MASIRDGFRLVIQALKHEREQRDELRAALANNTAAVQSLQSLLGLFSDKLSEFQSTVNERVHSIWKEQQSLRRDFEEFRNSRSAE